MMLVLCNALVIVMGIGFGAAAAVVALRHTPTHWPWRREAQLFVLTAPLAGLLLSAPSVAFLPACIGENASALSGACVYGNMALSTQIAALDGLFTLALIVVVVGAIALGVGRHVLLVQFMKRTTLPASPDLQTLAGHLAMRLSVAQPRVRLRVSNQPLALTYGLRQPTLVISTWIVERFDQHELEAVLAHELAHVARHDYLVLWLATVCRDAFCYLPTTWIAFRQLQHEKEVACDDLAIHITKSPLGLASALAKVWQQAVAAPPGLARGLAEASDVMEGRIVRLLNVPKSTSTFCSTPVRPLKSQFATVAGMLFLGTLLTLGMLLLTGCATR